MLVVEAICAVLLVKGGLHVRMATPASAACVQNFSLNSYAALQIMFICPVTVVMHDFWSLPDGTGAQQVEFVNFFKVGVFAGCW